MGVLGVGYRSRKSGDITPLGMMEARSRTSGRIEETHAIWWEMLHRQWSI